VLIGRANKVEVMGTGLLTLEKQPGRVTIVATIVWWELRGERLAAGGPLTAQGGVVVSLGVHQIMLAAAYHAHGAPRYVGASPPRDYPGIVSITIET